MGRIIAAGIDAASNVGTAAMNYKAQMNTNESNERIAQETNEANRQLAQQQNEWNLQQWQRENAYNNPAEQVKRLQGAGLSHAAAAQAIEGAGNASSIQSANLATDQIGNPMVAPSIDFNAIPSVLHAMREIVGLKKDENEASISEQEAQQRTKMLLTENDAKQADIELKRQQYQQLAKSFPYSLRALRYQSKADKYLPAQRQADLELMKANRQQVEQNVKLARQQFSFLDKMNEKQLDKMNAEIRNVVEQYNLFKSQEKVNASQVNLNNVSAAVQGETKENLQHIRKGIDLDNAIKDVQRIMNEYGCPENMAQRIGALCASGKVKINELIGILKGTKDYLHYGHMWYGNDPYTVDFLHNIFDEGRAAANKYSPHQAGYLRDIMDNSLFRQWFKSP